MEQLSIEQFRQLKAKLNAAKNNIDDYMSIEEDIVSFDLSNIPFEEWNGMKIIGSIDFTGTHANLDFRQVQFNNLCNFETCNLQNIPVPELPLEWQEKCKNRELTYKDIIENIEIFEGIPVRYYLKEDNELPNLTKIIGNHLISDLIKEHYDVFSHILQKEKLNLLNDRINTQLPFEESFVKAVKDYARNGEFIRVLFYDDNHNIYYELPEWLNSMNFNLIENYNSIEEYESHNIYNYVVKDGMDEFINIINIDYLKRFEEENNLFFKSFKTGPQTSNYLNIFANYIYVHTDEETRKNIKNNQNSYEDFCDLVANLLSKMREHNYFTDYPDYDFMDGEFREKYSQIFVEKNAPEFYRKSFYKNQLSPNFIRQHPELVPYLVDKDLLSIIKSNIPRRFSNDGETNYHTNFAKNVIYKFGNNELLMIYAKYGDEADKLENIEQIETPFELEEAIHNYFYDKIINTDYKYDELRKDKEFVSKHSSLFLDLTDVEGIPEDKKRFIEKAFHDRYLPYEMLHQYPQLKDILKHKELKYAFNANGLYRGDNPTNYLFSSNPFYQKAEQQNLLNYVSKEKFIDLCIKYGRYLEDRRPIDNISSKTETEIEKELDQQIIDDCRNGKINYFPDDVPEFIKEQQDLFISDSAPEPLKKKFYSTMDYQLTFRDLKSHPEWMEYLEGKSIKTALIRSSYYKDQLTKYFDNIKDKAIKLGINKADTVEKMITNEKVDTLIKWYEKTNYKFIPDIVIMNNFDLDNADKFLINGPVWSNLMRIKSFTKDEDTREALLKVAYTFGAFDNDNAGYKKAVELFTSLPREIRSEDAEIITTLNDTKNYEKVIANNIPVLKEIENYLTLKDTLIKEGYNYDDSLSPTENVYRKQGDGSYKLLLNPQSYPKSATIIRQMLESIQSAPVINPLKAHQLFGGFELKYDKDFREFFLDNLEEIIKSEDASAYLSSIQKQFQDIKTANSNRHLTLNLAVSYVQKNKYTNVEIGNEEVSTVSAIAGYTQSEFDVLQRIYNHGKTRIFNSIPRVENTLGDYKYELLKLNDPLTLAIGTLTDCCQEINNAAEMCMEHSMVSKEGRVFVIKDTDNNIIAQSWTWRNKSTLCFDNIEIPDKAFIRREKNGKTREDFTNEVYEVYKAAAQELIRKDTEAYKKALENNEITEEDYNNLRLNKVTVGLGYNDIANSLKKNATLDKGVVDRPMYFDAPVELRRSLYTNDSTTQYILEQEENENKTYTTKIAPYLYHDDYEIIDNNNMSEKELLQLQKLELITKEKETDMQTDIYYNEEDHDLVSRIARNYGTNKENTKIMIHPNFAIIYEDKGYEVNIADIFYNTKVGNEQRDIEDKVLMQLNLGIKQIADNRDIDTHMLEGKAKDIYRKQEYMNDLINKERGVENGK